MKSEILFALVDQDGSSTIDKDEFMHFSKVMLIEFKRHSVQPIFIEKYFPHTFESTGFKVRTKHKSSQMKLLNHVSDIDLTQSLCCQI